jgi:hypothetical protein
MTCQRCGADAMSADGRCEACGWRRGDDRAREPDSSPSLAQTRAADIPPLARPPFAARGGPSVPFATGGGGQMMPPARLQSRPGSTMSGAGARHCATCGAPIEAGQQFCGECGAAVANMGVSGPEYGTQLHRSHYPSATVGSSADAWSPTDYDAPTEEFLPLSPGMAPGYPHVTGRGSGVPSRGMSREMRIVFGILCILGGLVSGAGAIAIALAK